MKTLQELREDLNYEIRASKEIAEAAEKENRALSEDEISALDNKEVRIGQIKSQIDQLEKDRAVKERVERHVQALTKPEERKIPPQMGEPETERKPRIESSGFRFGRLKAFTRRDTRVENETDAYKSGMFIAATVFNSPKAKEWCAMNLPMNAHSESVNADGGFLVPAEMEQTIIDNKDEYGVFSNEARTVVMGSDVRSVPVRKGGLTVYGTGEGDAATESQASFGNVDLVAKKGSILTLMSSELEEDAIISMADFVADEIALAFAEDDDKRGFVGDGTSTYRGAYGIMSQIEDDSNLAGHVLVTSGSQKFTEIDAEDLANLIGALPDYAHRNAKFYCSRQAFAAIFQRLAASAGGNSVETLDGGLGMQYGGYPIVISEVLKKGSGDITAGEHMLGFGDLSRAAIYGVRRGIRIAVSNEHKFAEDQVAIKATQRNAIVAHDVGDSSGAGPFVALISQA